MQYSESFKNYVQTVIGQKISSFNKVVNLECSLTTECLNDCSYCAADIRGEQGEIDFDVLIKHIENYKSYAELNRSKFLVALVGADNFLYSKFNELVEYLGQHKIKYYVKGNASTLTKVRALKLKETGCLMIRLTVYGEPEIHNANRGLDTFDLLVERTLMTKEIGLPVLWHLSVGAENIESMKRLIPFVQSLGLDGVTEGRIARAGAAADHKFTDLTPSQWKEFLLYVLQYYYNKDEPNKFNIQFRDKLWIPLLVEEGLLDLSKFENNTFRCGCDTVTDLATIDFRGYIKGCALFESCAQAATPGTNVIKFIPNNEKKVFVAKENATQLNNSFCSKCDYFNFCRGCRAITLANTGDLNAQDPQCWIMR